MLHGTIMCITISTYYTIVKILSYISPRMPVILYCCDKEKCCDKSICHIIITYYNNDSFSENNIYCLTYQYEGNVTLKLKSE